MGWVYQTCELCGGDITFATGPHGPYPIHRDGPCPGRMGWSNYGSGASLRTTRSGEPFEFPFTLRLAYFRPNARCPLCGKEVFFYRSPSGGRVLFDELGPPWPKHPCTDHPEVQCEFETPERRAKYLLNAGGSAVAAGNVSNAPSWVQRGWIPFVVRRMVNRLIGIEAYGDLYDRGEDAPTKLRIWQTSPDAVVRQTKGHISIGLNFISHAGVCWDALNESPVLMKKKPGEEHWHVATFIFREQLTPMRFMVEAEPAIDSKEPN